MTDQELRDRYDVVIVGAGWSGMYMLYQARRLGMKAIVLEAGNGVGGTWYWNRFPGARCDVPSLNYSYAFSEELEQEWSWTELYAAQPEIERYANYAADKFDLKRDIKFGTRLTRAVYDAERRTWQLDSDQGDRLEARYAIMATGGYSQPLRPDIPGLDTFEGELYFTQEYPETPVDYAGKRIGVVGTGATGMQVVTSVAEEPVEHLYVFQRTANFAVPAMNAPMDPEYERDYKANYRHHRERGRTSATGSLYEGPFVKVADLSDEEFEAHMDMVYARGGSSVYGGLTDLLASEEVNARVAEYLNRRVRGRVDDPETAELLCASGHFVGSRRILIENGYFEKFNQDNVSLVSVKEDPIAQITPTGLRLESGREIELDVLIFATGFDSGTGAVRQIEIIGQAGSLNDKWAAGPVTYLGLMVHDFPNMFFIAGPGSPSIRSQVLVSIEQHVEWLVDFFKHLESEDAVEVDATELAELQWTEHLNGMVNSTLLARDDTQFFGVNVPGKPRAYVAYIGGTAFYRSICDAVAANNYEGFARITARGEKVDATEGWTGVSAPVVAVKSLENSVI
jgi:cation diffusion facilitator CzcD-associated flavoprotein CzcO